MKFPKINAYVCESCKRVTVTVNVDDGVTPMFMACPFPTVKESILSKGSVCGMQAVSFMYRLAPCFYSNPLLAAEWEWYKPSEQEAIDKKYTQAAKDHVAAGGLMLRARTDKEPIMVGPASDEGLKESAN